MSVEAEFVGVAEALELAVLAGDAEGFAVVQTTMEVREVATKRRGKATARESQGGRTALTLQ